MALVRCDECGRQISDKAQSCPGCGAPANPLPSIVREAASLDMASQAATSGRHAPKKKNVKYLRRWLIFIIAGVALTYFSIHTPDISNDSAGSLSGGSFGIGDEVLLATGSSGVVVVPVSKPSYDRLEQLLIAEDWLGVAEMVATGRAFETPNATTAKIISVSGSRYEVRITSGDQAGRSGWVSSSIVECLRDCR